MNPTLPPDTIAAIVGGYHGAPFDVLGLHNLSPNGGDGMVVRAFRPDAADVTVLRADGSRQPMARIHAEGLFEAHFPDAAKPFRYELGLTTDAGVRITCEDPYRFPPVLTDFDLHLFGEGNHTRLYDKLGAHLIVHEDVAGVVFAVWAPNAERVSVVGSFNAWDGRRNPMQRRGSSGIWELFVPGLATGDLYKYEIKTGYKQYTVLKTDPFGFAAELRPRTASVVCDLAQYEWGDAEWMQSRAARQKPDVPVSVYELHLGSWRRGKTYRDLARELVSYVRDLGFTHIELLPVTEHPLDASWGYQTIGYFAPTSRFGAPSDFMAFVDACHQAGLGVILDWVPAHFPRDEHGLVFFDGTHLYEHADPRQGEHPDWGTKVFNYGRTEVVAFLLNSALFWLDRYHIDGLRVDAVASMLYLDYSRKEGEWVPNKFGGRENLEAVAFLKRFNELVHLEHPDVLTIAEESTAWPMVSRPTYLGGLGFDLKWNMGWMHDTLEYMEKDPVHRRFHHDLLTFSLLYAFNENFILPFSHDEVVHGKRAMLAKMPGDVWQQFANLRLLYAYLFTHPGKKLLFMGAEFGQWREWDHDGELDWALLESDYHRQLQACTRDLNRLYVEQPALHEVDFDWSGFEWIDFRDMDQSIVSFMRRAAGAEDFVVVVCNFTPVPRFGYRVGVPADGFYRELFNSDAAAYGGSNLGNVGGVHAVDVPHQDRRYSLELTLPPLAVVVLKPGAPVP
ncbi:MAG: 1,4-alpha-glucan branching protein GlgB [Anaerolineales bacterium]